MHAEVSSALEFSRSFLAGLRFLHDRVGDKNSPVVGMTKSSLIPTTGEFSRWACAALGDLVSFFQVELTAYLRGASYVDAMMKYVGA